VPFLQVTLFRVGRLALVVFHEVVNLAEHRAGSAHLPHQPFDRAIALRAILGEQLAGLVGEVDQDRARLHQAQPIVAIDDRRDTIVRCNLEKIRLELFVLRDIDRMHRIGKT